MRSSEENALLPTFSLHGSRRLQLGRDGFIPFIASGPTKVRLT